MFRSVLRSAAWVTLLGGAFGLTTLFRDITIGRVYGMSGDVRAYLLWTLMGVLLINSAGAAMATSYTPEIYRQIGARSRPTSAFLEALVIAAVLAVLHMAFLAVRGVYVESPPSFTSRLTLDILLVTGMVMLGVLARFVIALLLAKHRNITASALQALVPAVMVAWIVWSLPRRTIDVMVLGLALGYAVQLLAALACWMLVAPAGSSNGAKDHEIDWAPGRRRFLTMFVGSWVLASIEYVEVSFAARHGEAAVVAVNHASRIVTLILGFIFAGLGNILTLRWIDIERDGVDPARARDALRRSLWTGAGFGVALAVATALLARPAATWVYVGSAMSGSDIDLFVDLLVIYALATPLVLTGFIAGRALVAKGQQRALMCGALTTLSVALVANAAFSAMRLPATSVVVATVLGHMGSAILLCRWSMHRVNAKDIA